MRSPALRHLAAIDGLRAVAVLAVLAFHTLLAASRGATAPFWIACGARGVELFFVISGFCLAYPYLRSYRSDGTSVVEYGRFLARRLSRVGPPYWVALCAFALLSLTAFGLPTVPGSHAVPTLREFLCDAIFLTNAFPSFDASFWTLGIEMRWYLLFPLVLAMYVRSPRNFGFVALGSYALYFFTPFGVADEGTLPCFMLGIVAADVCVTRHPLRRYAFATAAVSLAVACALQSRGPSLDRGAPLWHVACFALVVAATSGGVLGRVLRAAPLRFVGTASYGIYLVHQPIVDALASLGVAPWSCAFAALACGIGFSLAVERPLSNPRIRRAFEDAVVRAGRDALLALARIAALRFRTSS